MTDWLTQLASEFSAEDYLFWSRIQGSLWTAADIVICFYLIRLANLSRRILGVRRHVLSYVVLAATLPPSAFIPVVPTSTAFLRLELAVTIPHFLIIVYVMAANLRHARPLLERLGNSG